MILTGIRFWEEKEMLETHTKIAKWCGRLDSWYIISGLGENGREEGLALPKLGLNSELYYFRVKGDWELHSIQYIHLTSSRKRSVARFIHHRLPSGNMMFEYKHCCPFCQLNSTSNTDHDHFLTCALTSDSKNKRLTSLCLKLERLHAPPFLRDSIVNAIDK